MSIEQVSVDKQLIFTVTPGRSGTAYLTKLLEAVPDVSAHHEAQPDFIQVMRRIQTEPLAAYAFLCSQKLPAIRESPGKVYAETSHMACKGFIEPMIRVGLRPSLIFLRRPPREVAWSYFERRTIPCRTTGGIHFLLDPRDLNVMPFINWDAANDYQLCFWYALEIERRQLWYAQMARDLSMTTFDVTHRELNDWEIFARMLTTFGLSVTEEVRQNHAVISLQRHNQNKVCLDMWENLEEQEEAVWQRVGYFQPLLRDRILKRYAKTFVEGIGTPQGIGSHAPAPPLAEQGVKILPEGPGGSVNYWAGRSDGS